MLFYYYYCLVYNWYILSKRRYITEEALKLILADSDSAEEDDVDRGSKDTLDFDDGCLQSVSSNDSNSEELMVKQLCSNTADHLDIENRGDFPAGTEDVTNTQYGKESRYQCGPCRDHPLVKTKMCIKMDFHYILVISYFHHVHCI